MNRREILGLASFGVLKPWVRLPDGAATNEQSFSEQQSGDPDIPLQTLTVDLQRVRPLVDTGKSIGIQKDAHELVQQTLKIALADSISNPRPDDESIEEYLGLFGVGRDACGRLLPFCASGLCHAICRAYCDLKPDQVTYPSVKERANSRLRILRDVLADVNKFYFLPHCATQQMVADSKMRNTWVPKSTAKSVIKPGWLVFFNWPDASGHRSGLANHVGIVQSSSPEQLNTVEYNTAVTLAGNQREGGHISTKQRNYENVIGFIRTY
jgi:hypothetical protein